jgi:hypothetical protein
METFISNNSIWFLIITIFWVLPWKGLGLWIASQRNNKLWFIILLILNTFGILEIVYIFLIAKKKPSELLSMFKTKI